MKSTIAALTCVLCAGAALAQSATPAARLIRSAGSGAWSNATTWEGGQVPSAGARVQIRAGHAITYDVISTEAIRFLHIAGQLTFAHDRDTRLDVGLIKI